MYRNPDKMTFWHLQKNPDRLSKNADNFLKIPDKPNCQDFCMSSFIKPRFCHRDKHRVINFNNPVVNFSLTFPDPTVKTSSHLVFWNVVHTSLNLRLGGSTDRDFFSEFYMENFIWKHLTSRIIGIRANICKVKFDV